MPQIHVVGIGPGGPLDMTPRAVRAIAASDAVLGHGTYLDLIEELFPGKNFFRSGMTREVERCGEALAHAREGENVALVSSGDSGIYGMAGVMLEVAAEEGMTSCVDIIPGITAASAAGSVLGAPVMHDFAVVSLSDYLTPWETIVLRVRCAAEGDFVLCIYNPRSRRRTGQLGIVRNLLLTRKAPGTPVGIVRNAGRPGESFVLTTLEGLAEHEEKVDMFTVIIVGNSQTYVRDGRMITPRGYRL